MTPAPVGFATRTAYDTGTTPSATAVADFNGDGKMDFAIAMAGDDTIWIYLGDGTGNDSLPTILPLGGTEPTGLITVDANQDGKADLVVVETGSQTVGVLLGNGDGTFQPEIENSVWGAISVVAGDFNADGKLDLLVGQYAQNYKAPFSFLAGDGTGHFAAPVRQASTTLLAYGMAMAASDLNNDGKLDLVVVCMDCIAVDGDAQVYVGKGDGTFGPPTSIFFGVPDLFGGSGDLVNSVAIGDLNHDGCNDIVLGGTGAVAHVFLGSCDGKFTPNDLRGTLYAMGDTTGATVLADVDGDGNLDLVGGGTNAGPLQGSLLPGMANSGFVTVSKGDGQGHFLPSRTYCVQPGNWGLAVAELNGDGRLDIIAPSSDTSTLTVLMNDGTGQYGSPQGQSISYPVVVSGWTYPFYSVPNLMDVDGDGRTDANLFLWGSLSTGNYHIANLRNTGGGHFADAVLSDTGLRQDQVFISSFALGDFRHSGRPDLIASDLYAPKLWFAQNQGDGTLGTASTFASPSNGGVVETGDFNGDGNLDVVMAGPDPTQSFQQVWVMWGHGDGTFTEGPSTVIAQAGGGEFPSELFVSDFNRDGRMDLIYQTMVNGAGAGLYELFGNGDGTFGKPIQIFATPPFARMADMNSDGCPDLILPWADPSLSMSLPGVSVYLCQPDGSFQLAGFAQPYTHFAGMPVLWTAYATTMGTWPFNTTPQVIVGDFNGDGKQDIAYFEVPNYGGLDNPMTVGFLLGNGDGSLTPQAETMALHRHVGPQFAADLDGDGRADLIEVGKLSAEVSSYASKIADGFHVEFRQIPVAGHIGHLRLTLPMPATSPVTIQLQATDAQIGVPASATIPAGSATADVDFNVVSSWPLTQTFAITATMGSEQHRVEGYVAGWSSPAIEVSPQYLDFGSVDVGIPSAPQTITVRNYGTAASDVTVQAGMYSYYSVGGNCTTTLPPGASCQATVVYTPPYAQRQPDAVRIQHDGVSITIPTYIYGVAITTSVSVTPMSMSFRAADHTTSTAQALNIANTGTQQMVVAAQVSGNGFSQQPSTCGQAVAPGQSCTIAIQYTGDSSAFSSSGQVMISGDFPNSPILVTLTGTLLSGHVSVSPASLDFGTQPPYLSSTSQKITLTNNGGAALYFASIPGVADFGWNSTCPMYNTGLGAGQSCTFDVRFVPVHSGSLQENVQIVTSADNTPTIVALSGTALKSGFALSNGGSTSLTIHSGQQASYSLEYAFSGNAGTVQFTCSGVPSATCSVTPASSAVADGQVALAVTVSTQTYIAAAPEVRHGFGAILATGMAFPAIFVLAGRRKRWWLWGASLGLLTLTLALVSCGGGGGSSLNSGGGQPTPQGTAPGTYTVTVRAQGAGISDSYNLTLTVQ